MRVMVRERISQYALPADHLCVSSSLRATMPLLPSRSFNLLISGLNETDCPTC